jgi:hypothetical protein
VKPRFLLLAAALVLAGGPLRAEGFLAPFVGAAFGGNVDDNKLTYGGMLTFKAQDGIIGFAVDFGYTPDFLGSSGFGDNNLTSLMGNIAFVSPGTVKLYVSSGLGLIKTRVEDAAGLFDVDSNDFGFNAGGGVMVFFSPAFGLQGDFRYFRTLTDPEPDAEFDLDLGSLDYWRATGGIVIRF